MKIIKYIFIGIITLYFQILFASKFELLGVIPNFLIACLIFLNIKLDLIPSSIIIFFLGIALDLTYPSLLGLNTISFLLLSFLVNRYHQSINKDRIDIIFISIFALNSIHFLFFFLYYLFSEPVTFELFYLTFFTIFYNTVISMLLTYFFVFIDKIKVYLDV
ncbi:MAG TPA: rod shape-determining protein MreD [Candidatus Cloacimonetes bacterium]|nr:rod shape-determining protein MreD [Candidatus Cloacimonadota bacterium]